MEKITIGIEKRIPLSVLEMALRAVLDGNATSDYFLGTSPYRMLWSYKGKNSCSDKSHDNQE